MAEGSTSCFSSPPESSPSHHCVLPRAVPCVQLSLGQVPETAVTSDVRLHLFGLLLKQQMVHAQDTWDQGDTWVVRLTEVLLKFWANCWLHGVRGLPVRGGQSQGSLLSYHQVGNASVPASRAHPATRQGDRVCSLSVSVYTFSSCLARCMGSRPPLLCSDLGPLPLLFYCVLFRTLFKDKLLVTPFLTPFSRIWPIFLALLSVLLLYLVHRSLIVPANPLSCVFVHITFHPTGWWILQG